MRKMRYFLMALNKIFNDKNALPYKNKEGQSSDAQLLDKSKAQSPYNDNNKQPINFITQNNNNSNDQHQKNIQLKTEAKI